MDEAGRLCAAAILDYFPSPARAILFCGKGNNGGDALVVGGWLKRHGWSVELRLAGTLSELAQKKMAELEATTPPPSVMPDTLHARPLVLVDGLLGIGAKGALRGTILELAAEINALRREQHGTTFAIDLPSGFDADRGKADSNAVIADYTLSITQAKTGFVVDDAENHLGRLIEIPLDIPVVGDTSRRFLFPSHLRPRLQRRPFDTHKGAAGRVSIIAGSPGMEGAAVLAALGASRGGAGLVTVFVPHESRSIVAMKAPSEVMVRGYDSMVEATEFPADVYVLGPGLGSSPDPGLAKLILSPEIPAVVDADALNFLACHPEILTQLPPNRVLTPHPGEMARLDPTGRKGDRVHQATGFTRGHPCTLLLKGSRTVISTPGYPLEFNTTGHPGMASGGMGDVLSGLCGALIAQGYSLHDAACLGSWLLGRAAELACREDAFGQKVAPESISAPLVAETLGAALCSLQTPGRP